MTSITVLTTVTTGKIGWSVAVCKYVELGSQQETNPKPTDAAGMRFHHVILLLL